MMLFPHDATFHYYYQNILSIIAAIRLFFNLRIPSLNEQTNNCSISSKFIHHPIFLFFFRGGGDHFK